MEEFSQSSAPPLGYGKPSHEITEISAGEAHTLALTEDGSVYSWGRGMFGRLGTGSELDQMFPVKVEFGPTAVKVVAIAAGAYHSLALADDGSIWGWGYNVYGQLDANGENYLAPHLLEGFLGLGSPNASREDSKRKTLTISSVKAGAMMSLAIDSLGGLWIWGNCPLPQENKSTEAEFSLTCTYNPIPVRSFQGHTVVKVACGNEHVVALVTIGEIYEGYDLVCYSWGGNSHGQLGLGDKESRIFPEIVVPFNSVSPWYVHEVACGAFHTALLAHESGHDVSVWTFGLGENGQLGHGTNQSCLYPEPVKELTISGFLVSVDCGLFHTSVVSSAGDVWSWGMEKGLGLCPDARFTGDETGDAMLPLLISRDGHKFHEPVQVVCGAAHTILLADFRHKLWSWGRGRSGVLGTGQTNDTFTPTPVMWPPPVKDFKGELLDDGDEKKKSEETKPMEIIEMEEKLSTATREIKLLQSKLSITERYASILHSSIFGRPFHEQDVPASVESRGTFEIEKEWENILESSDSEKLVRLEMFYRNMLASVKDTLLKKRIKEIVVDCLGSSR